MNNPYLGNEITQATSFLTKGMIGVMPTDTIYGLVGSACNEQTAERIYQVKRRNPSKPMIVLISHFNDLGYFAIAVDGQTQQKLATLWPGSVSVVLPCSSDRFTFLHRGTRSIAFRLPDKPDLIDLLRETGPLIATSANREGKPPAETCQQAQSYFSQEVDFYIDGGTIIGQPSTLVTIENGKVEVLRESERTKQ